MIVVREAESNRRSCAPPPLRSSANLLPYLACGNLTTAGALINVKICNGNFRHSWRGPHGLPECRLEKHRRARGFQQLAGCGVEVFLDLEAVGAAA